MEEEQDILTKDSYKDIAKTTFRSIRFTWNQEKTLLSLDLLLNIIGAAFIFLQLVSFSTIINEIIRIKELGLGITDVLIRNSIFLSLSFFIPSLVENFNALVSMMLRTKLGTKINLYLVDIYSTFDIGTIESEEFQKKRDRANKWGASSINNLVYWAIRILRDVVGVVVSGLVLYFINPYLVALAILGALPYYFIEQKYGKQIFNLTWVSTDESRIEDDRMSHFRNPKKIVEVLLFNLKKLFRKQISDINNKYDQNLIGIQKKESYVTIAADIFQNVCLIAAVALVTFETIHGSLMVGALFLAFTSYRGFLGTTQSFFSDYARLTEQARFAKYWFDIFDIKPRIMNKSDAQKPVWPTPPTIEFIGVSFAYPQTDKLVLKDVSLVLKSGEKLAIVGENGAGKTTFVKLLCRIYDPTEGEILVDGINLKDIDVAHWHTYLGVLFQDFTNYSLTIRESIAISVPDEPIDDTRVVQAAEMVGADAFINEFPKKYDQLVWKGFDDGVELSKGQFQRLAVARIFYRDALISILDEPTSAIDAVAEEKIFEVLETKMSGKTVVLISHRFSTVKNADKIAVIEHGELKELGNHKDLMKKAGRYAELYTMQANRYLESE